LANPGRNGAESVANSALVHASFAGLRFFSFTPFGLAVLAAGEGCKPVVRRLLAVPWRRYR